MLVYDLIPVLHRLKRLQPDRAVRTEVSANAKACVPPARRGADGSTYVIADGGVAVNQPLHVAVDAAARRKLGQRGRMRFLLSLLYNDLAGFPLGHDLLIPESNVLIHLQTDRS